MKCTNYWIMRTGTIVRDFQSDLQLTVKNRKYTREQSVDVLKQEVEYRRYYPSDQSQMELEPRAHLIGWMDVWMDGCE